MTLSDLAKVQSLIFPGSLQLSLRCHRILINNKGRLHTTYLVSESHEPYNQTLDI